MEFTWDEKTLEGASPELLGGLLELEYEKNGTSSQFLALLKIAAKIQDAYRWGGKLIASSSLRNDDKLLPFVREHCPELLENKGLSMCPGLSRAYMEGHLDFFEQWREFLRPETLSLNAVKFFEKNLSKKRFGGNSAGWEIAKQIIENDYVGKYESFPLWVWILFSGDIALASQFIPSEADEKETFLRANARNIQIVFKVLAETGQHDVMVVLEKHKDFSFYFYDYIQSLTRYSFKPIDADLFPWLESFVGDDYARVVDKMIEDKSCPETVDSMLSFLKFHPRAFARLQEKTNFLYKPFHGEPMGALLLLKIAEKSSVGVLKNLIEISPSILEETITDFPGVDKRIKRKVGVLNFAIRFKNFDLVKMLLGVEGVWEREKDFVNEYFSRGWFKSEPTTTATNEIQCTFEKILFEHLSASSTPIHNPPKRRL